MATQGAYGPPGAELQRLYDADAVDRYVAQLQSHIEDLQTQVTEAMAAAQEAQEKAAAVGTAEAILGRALLAAQRAADESIADAQRQAGLILAEARRDGDRLLGDVRAEAQRIVDEAHETVEAVFAALPPQRQPTPFSPPPVASWAPPAPVPGNHEDNDAQADEDDTDVKRWAPPATASMEVATAPHGRPSNGEGTIVDLRPGWAGTNDSNSTSAHLASADRAPTEWGSALGGTGTEGTPMLALALALAPSPAPRVPEARPGGDLLDRWRVARNGPASFGDDLLSRQGHLDSLTDGSYVSQLREDDARHDEFRVGADPTETSARDAHPAGIWEPKAPPVGPAVVRPARRFGLLGRRPR